MSDFFSRFPGLRRRAEELGYSKEDLTLPDYPVDESDSPDCDSDSSLSSALSTPSELIRPSAPVRVAPAPQTQRERRHVSRLNGSSRRRVRDVLEIRGRDGPFRLRDYLETSPNAVNLVRVLHIHLREEWHDDFTDDMWAIQLRRLADSTSLQELHLYAAGNFLFTHMSYTLVSPWQAMDSDQNAVLRARDELLHAFASGEQLNDNDRAELDFKFHAAPKQFVNALYGLTRKNQKGEVKYLKEFRFWGPVEPALVQTLRRTLVNTEYESDDEEDSDSSLAVDSEDLTVIPHTKPKKTKFEKRTQAHGNGYINGPAFPTSLDDRVALGVRLTDLAAMKNSSTADDGREH